MLLRNTLLALAATSLSLAAPLLDKRQGATRGVNLGGWLVLEPWITPSMFAPYNGAAVDEYTLCQIDPEGAPGRLQAHWQNWVTLGDFQRIANSGKGINLVRIPIGYWAFQKYSNDPYVQGAKEYLGQALDWASQTGLQVWIDLHGAPLSQNGFDNSGQRTNSPQFTSGDTNSFTAGVLGQLAAEFGGHPAVVGIQLLNEPLMASLPGGRDGVASFFGEAYGAVKGATDKTVVLSDGFATPSSWNGFLTDTILDHHDYQVFSSEDNALSWQQHVDAVYSRAASWGAGVDKRLICGEWSAAMTDCAAGLNGYGIGARYDGTFSRNNGAENSYYIGSCATKNFIDLWDQPMRDATRNFIQASINAYESNADGWIFWNFKTEASAEWDFFRLVDNGVWP